MSSLNIPNVIPEMFTLSTDSSASKAILRKQLLEIVPNQQVDFDPNRNPLMRFNLSSNSDFLVGNDSYLKFNLQFSPNDPTIQEEVHIDFGRGGVHNLFKSIELRSIHNGMLIQRYEYYNRMNNLLSLVHENKEYVSKFGYLSGDVEPQDGSPYVIQEDITLSKSVGTSALSLTYQKEVNNYAPVGDIAQGTLYDPIIFNAPVGAFFSHGAIAKTDGSSRRNVIVDGNRMIAAPFGAQISKVQPYVSDNGTVKFPTYEVYVKETANVAYPASLLNTKLQVHSYHRAQVANDAINYTTIGFKNTPGAHELLTFMNVNRYDLQLRLNLPNMVISGNWDGTATVNMFKKVCALTFGSNAADHSTQVNARIALQLYGERIEILPDLLEIRLIDAMSYNDAPKNNDGTVNYAAMTFRNSGPSINEFNPNTGATNRLPLDAPGMYFGDGVYYVQDDTQSFAQILSDGENAFKIFGHPVSMDEWEPGVYVLANTQNDLATKVATQSFDMIAITTATHEMFVYPDATTPRSATLQKMYARRLYTTTEYYPRPEPIVTPYTRLEIPDIERGFVRVQNANSVTSKTSQFVMDFRCSLLNHTLPLFLMKGGIEIIFELDSASSAFQCGVEGSYKIVSPRIMGSFVTPHPDIVDSFASQWKSEQGLVYRIPSFRVRRLFEASDIGNNAINTQVGVRSAQRVYWGFMPQILDELYSVSKDYWVQGNLSKFQLRVGSHEFPMRDVEISEERWQEAMYQTMVNAEVMGNDVRLKPMKVALSKNNTPTEWIYCVDLRRAKGKEDALCGVDLSIVPLDFIFSRNKPFNQKLDGTPQQWAIENPNSLSVCYVFVEHDAYFKLSAAQLSVTL